MTSNHVWDYGTPHERGATEEEFDKITKDIHYKFVKDGGKKFSTHTMYDTA
jgi:hypothetical protein